MYPTHTEADQAIEELQRGGVDMHKLSIIGKGYKTEPVGYYRALKNALLARSPKTDQFLLIAHGTAAEMAKAKDIIEMTHPARLSLHTGKAASAAAVTDDKAEWKIVYVIEILGSIFVFGLVGHFVLVLCRMAYAVLK